MEKFVHKKSLGQNFLQDEKVLKNIASSIKTEQEDLIIEIGPGLGALTKYLKEKDGNLLCYEIDERLRPNLSVLEDDKCHIIWQDFLQVDLKEIAKMPYKKIYFIANIPYYITTPIIEKITSSKLDVKEMVFLVQKEVALRLSATEGNKEYGALTVLLSYDYDIEYLFTVKKEIFVPSPKVDSAVIKMTKVNRKMEVKNKDLFKKLVRDSFAMKRKNIRNNLRNYDLAIVERILNKYNYTLQNRAEELPLECFITLANELKIKM